MRGVGGGTHRGAALAHTSVSSGLLSLPLTVKTSLRHLGEADENLQKNGNFIEKVEFPKYSHSQSRESCA